MLNHVVCSGPKITRPVPFVLRSAPIISRIRPSTVSSAGAPTICAGPIPFISRRTFGPGTGNQRRRIASGRSGSRKKADMAESHARKKVSGVRCQVSGLRCVVSRGAWEQAVLKFERVRVEKSQGLGSEAKRKLGNQEIGIRI